MSALSDAWAVEMQQIHFSERDLVNVRIEGGASVFTETMLSLARLRARDGARKWRSAASSALPANVGSKLLGSLPPQDQAETVLLETSGDKALLGASRRAAYADLTQRVRRRPVPSCWMITSDADPRASGLAGDVLYAYYRAALAPWWSLVLTAVDATRRQLSRRIADGGVETLLSTLHPAIGWDRRRTLLLPGNRHPGIDLSGRGLIVLPSVFARAPAVFTDPGGSPVLVVPAGHTTLGTVTKADAANTAGLAKLIGATRASILASLEEPRTTTELARRADVTPGAASQHAAALRDSGLITSQRRGRYVFHAITPLGEALLTGRG